MVAPNGARLGKADHPAVPISNEDIVACARDCHAAGAGGIHAHIRDDNGMHVLDTARYRDIVQALRSEVPKMEVQITTEAVGCYDPQHQMQVALNTGADMVSVSIREISRAGIDTTRKFFEDCKSADIAVQHILYDAHDCSLLESVLGRQDLEDQKLQLLYVLGRYSERLEASPEDLEIFLDWQMARSLKPDWAVCAFGAKESLCLRRAHEKGGKCRVGFENSLFLSDGNLSPSNAAKVHDLVRVLDPG